MSEFALMQGDGLPIIRGELTDASGVVNIAGSSVYFVFRPKYGVSVPNSGLATIVDAAGGIVEYSWTSTDTATPNVYYGFWRVSGSDGVWSSFPNDSYFRFIINPVL